MCWPHFHVFAEVLLDMNAIGGELGWLTWPLDQGDRPGVSRAPSSSLQLPCFCLDLTSGEFCIVRMHRKGPKRLVHKHLTLWRMWLGVKRSGVCTCQAISADMHVRRSSLEGMLGLHRSLVNRKAAFNSQLEIVVASCGFKASTLEFSLREQLTFAACGASHF